MDRTLTNAPPADGAEVDPSLLTIEHYAVERELAHGGLGRILVARDRRLGRQVALKVPIDPVVEGARFAHEVRITSRLQHPSIVPLYEAGRLPSGEPFFAMKLVGGRPLSVAIAEARTPAERLALLPSVIAVADAIAYAHDQKIVHRDLKPSNVVLGAFGESVVLDWGVALDVSAGETDDGLVGTPAYMAPEQAAGAPADPRFDVYAVGAVLYHLLAGEPPYLGADSQTVLRALAAGPPPPIEARFAATPPELAAIVKKAMARAPHDRYPTARELAADLRRFQTGQLVGAHAYSPWALFRRWLRKHRLTVAVGAALGAALAAQGIFAVQRIARARAEAERRRDALTLAQARTELRHDPTAALAWLKQYPPGGADWPQARTLAADALDSGVARDVFRNAELARITSDGRLIFTRSDGLELWHDGVGRKLACPDDAWDIEMSPDGAALASFSRRGALWMWDTATGQGKKVWDGPGQPTLLAEMFWSPDGNWLAAFAGKNEIWLFPRTGGAPRRFDAATFEHDLAFSPDGKWMAVGGVDKLIKLWRLDTGEKRIFSGHTDAVRKLAFSADGRELASASHDGTVRLWDVASGTSRAFLGHTPRVVSVRFLPDGRLVSCGGDDGTVRLWNRDGTGRVLYQHRGATYLDVSPDGKRIATGGEDQIVRVWDLATGDTWTLRGHGGPVLRVQFYDGGRGVLSSSFDRGLRAWELRPGAGRVFDEDDGAIQRLAWSADGKWVATASWDRKVRLCDPSSSCRVLGVHPGPALSVAIAPDSRTIASGGADGSVKVWTPDGTARELGNHGGPVKRLAFSPDSRELVTAGDGLEVKLWDLATAKSRVIITHDDIVMSVAFSPDGAHIASTAMDTTVRVFSRDEKVTVLRGHTEWAMSAAFSPDGKSLASTAFDGTVRVWDLATGSGRIVGRHELGGVLVVYSPDGRTLASASIDKTARLWDLASGQSRVLRGHEANLRPMAFAPDGKRLATAADDGTIRVWDVATGEGRVLRGHEGVIYSIAWSADGTRLFSGGADKTARLWQLDALTPVPRDPAAALVRFAQASTAVLGALDDPPSTR